MAKKQVSHNLKSVNQVSVEPRTQDNGQENAQDAAKANIVKIKDRECATDFGCCGKASKQNNDRCLHLVDDMPEDNGQSLSPDKWSDLREVLNAIPFYVMLIDGQHTILFANNTTGQSLGVDPENIVGGYCPKVIHGLDDPFPGCPLDEAVEENRVAEADLYEEKYNMWFQSAIYPTPLKTKEGSPIYLHMVRDITEKKQAIDVIRETNQTLQTLIQASPLAIIVLDNDGNIMMWNPAAEQIFGWSEHEVLFHPCPGIKEDVQEDNQGASGKLSDRITIGKSFTGLELFVRRKDGSSIDISISGAPLYDSSNNIKGTMVMVADITEKKQAERELKHSLEKLQRTVEGTVLALALMAEKRDPYTAGHQHRVAKLACAIAEEMGLPKDQIDGIHMAGTLHDIGKVSVPAEILSKPGRLTETEFSMVKNHPQDGFDILKTIEFPWPVAQIALQHHERMNGSGYPYGLSGEDILLEARIIAVADVVDAMASHRPYRPSRGIEEALKEISENRGFLYDPAVVDACLKLFSENRYSIEQ